MHPPRIVFNYLSILFSITSIISADEEKNELDNSTLSRLQRETSDRERRLIPYMTYYVTQSVMTPNTGTRQNIFLPITSPSENTFHLDTVTKIPLNNFQNINPQQIEILPKPVVTLPSLLTRTIQADQNKGKEESGIIPHIYKIEPELIRAHVQAQKTPVHLIKINPTPTEQKHTPRIIKIIPLITNLPPQDISHKSFNFLQSHSAYSRANAYTLSPGAQLANDKAPFKERIPLHNENSFQENKLYSDNFSPENAKLRLPNSEPNEGLKPYKYTIAQIAFRTTTPSPVLHTDIKFNGNVGKFFKTESDPNQISISPLAQVNRFPTDYGREPVLSTVGSFREEKYMGVTPEQQQTYYDQKTVNGQRQESQGSVQIQNAKELPRLRVPQEEKIRFVASVTPVAVINELERANWKINDEGQKENIYDNQPLNKVLSLLKETNKLPQNLTPDNIDTSIKTLALILERLQKHSNYLHGHQIPVGVSSTVEPPTVTIKETHQSSKKVHIFPEKSGTSTPGIPGIDYPIYSSIPQTNFDCSTQRYKGFFGDPDTKCQVWHYCDLNGGQASFLCPNGTIFSQVALTCDWWFNVKCASTSQLYVLNERLYKYILPFSPSFPEDYSGPVVDTYLAAKFKEMEAKSKAKVLKSQTNSTSPIKPEVTTESSTETHTELIDYKISNIEE